nr:unnamed protein product [Callosobruchus chinensis]
MEKFNWTREDTCLLIENFKLYPELWNVHTAELKAESKSRMRYKNWPTYSIILQRKFKESYIIREPKLAKNGEKFKKRKVDKELMKQIKSTWKFFHSLKFIIDSNIQNNLVT